MRKEKEPSDASLLPFALVDLDFRVALGLSAGALFAFEVDDLHLAGDGGNLLRADRTTAPNAVARFFPGKIGKPLFKLGLPDDFAALDLCVFDLNTALAHFVKLGGVQSFVKRADVVDVIDPSALPIGIVEEARPYTVSRMLSPTDCVVLVTDGVADALGADGIKLILSRTETLSPQEVFDIFHKEYVNINEPLRLNSHTFSKHGDNVAVDMVLARHGVKVLMLKFAKLYRQTD